MHKTNKQGDFHIHVGIDYYFIVGVGRYLFHIEPRYPSLYGVLMSHHGVQGRANGHVCKAFNTHFLTALLPSHCHRLWVQGNTSIHTLARTRST
jgi:hypothetical protein